MRNLKRNLKKIYAGPKPLRKQEFMRKIREPESTFGDFLWRQAGYIRRWNWIIAAIFFLAALWGARTLRQDAVWLMAGCTPYLALATVAEGNRSVQYGMEELELSARFTLKSIVMARLVILGIGNLLLLAAAFPIISSWGQSDIYFGSICVFLPYLLNAFANLFIVRKIHGRESQYFCIAITILISCLYFLTLGLQQFIFKMLDYRVWFGVMAVLAVLTGLEVKKYVEEKEEYGWSL